MIITNQTEICISKSQGIKKLSVCSSIINMEDIIAGVDDIKFDMEVCLEQQLGIQPLPFPGMDSTFKVWI